MAEENSLAQFVVYFEDWIGGEPVTVISTVLPNNVTDLTASKVGSTTVTLSWTASTSADVTGYDVFNGSTLVGTTTGTTYEITQLAESTGYTFTVKTNNAAGNASSGVSLQVTTLKTSYALSMNGTSDYIVTPTLTFDTVVMDFAADQKAGAYSAYLDATRGIANAAFIRTSSGTDLLQAAWRTLYVDNVDKTSVAGSSAVIPSKQRTTIQLVLPSSGKSSIYIFANQLGSIPMKGTLYGIKIMLNGNVVAYYDLTTQFSGTVVPDQSGNNHPATLKGGTWIIL